MFQHTVLFKSKCVAYIVAILVCNGMCTHLSHYDGGQGIDGSRFTLTV